MILILPLVVTIIDRARGFDAKRLSAKPIKYRPRIPQFASFRTWEERQGCPYKVENSPGISIPDSLDYG